MTISIDVDAAAAGPESGLVHAVLLYRSDREYLDEVMAFVRDGIASDEPVMVVLPTEHLAVINEALGNAAAEVTMLDIKKVGRNPGRILALAALFAADHPDRRLRVTAEPVWPGRSADEYPGCVQTEALVNTAFAGQSVTVLCPFDASRLDGLMLSDTLATHPWLWRSGRTAPSGHYAPADALARYNQPLAADTTGARYTVNTLAGLSAARSFAGRYAGWMGMCADGIADLRLIVTELATNSLEHAKSPCWLSFWQSDGRLVCEARDHGRMEDPLAGRLPPRRGEAKGHGLFLVNALADLVCRHTTDNGVTIQAHVRLRRDG